jgi:hypothetical protein
MKTQSVHDSITSRLTPERSAQRARALAPAFPNLASGPRQWGNQDGGSVLVGDVSPHIGDTTGEGYWLEDHGVEYDFHNRIEI